MKKIVKTIEPKSLTKYRSEILHQDLEKSNIYEDFPEKTQEDCKNNIVNNLRKQLLEEQGYICCYCMSRINCDNSKIEHFKPQTKYRNLQIDYRNLFIACGGGTGKKGKYQFCDTKKGEDELEVIDLLHHIENHIQYEKHSQNIAIKSSDRRIQNDIDRVLNLNISLLQKNRKEQYDSFLKKLKTKGYSLSNIQKTLNFYKMKHGDKYEPYCEMIVYFLTKKLKSKGI